MGRLIFAKTNLPNHGHHANIHANHYCQGMEAVIYHTQLIKSWHAEGVGGGQWKGSGVAWGGFLGKNYLPVHGHNAKIHRIITASLPIA